MKKQLYLFLIFILCFTAICSSQVNSYIRTYGSNLRQEGASFIQMGDGGFTLLGRTNSSGAGVDDVLLIRLDALGNIVFSKTYGNTGNDEGTCIKRTNDGGYIILGRRALTTNSNIYSSLLIKTDSLGNLEWSKVYSLTASQTPINVIETNDNGFVFVGRYTGSNEEGFIVKTDVQGNILWQKAFSGSGYDMLWDVCLTNDGGYVVSGVSGTYAVAGGADFIVVKFDSLGNIVWSRVAGNANFNSLYSGIPTSDGGFLFSGYSIASDREVHLLKLSSTGVVLWATTYTSTFDEISPAVKEVPGGYLMYTWAYANNNFGVADIGLIRTDTLGNLLYSRKFGSTGGDGGIINTNTLQFLSDSTYGAIGYTQSFGYGANGSNVFFIKTDTQGLVPGGCPSAVYTLTKSNMPLTVGTTVNFVSGAFTTPAYTVLANNAVLCSTNPCQQNNPFDIYLGPDIDTCATSVTINAGNSGSSFLWNTGDQTQSLTVDSSGLYVVSIQNTCGTAVDSIMVDLTAGAININLGADIDTCSGSLITLNAGNPGNTYLWNTGDTTQVINPTSNGIYFVDVTGVCGTDRDTVALNFAPIQPFNINLGNDTLICPGASIQLNAGINGLTYNWNTNQTTQTINVANPGIYWLRANNDCYIDIDTLIIGINVAQPVSVNLGIDIDSCTINWPLTLDAGNANNSYQWNTGAVTQTIQVNAPDTFYVEVYNSCYNDIDTIVISLNPTLPVSVNLGNDIDTCIVSQVDLSTLLTGTGNLLWSTGDTTDNITITQAGVYFATYTNQCYSDTDSITVTFNPSSPFALVGDTLICPQEITSLQPNINGNNYLWNDGSTDPTLQVSAPGTYWLQLTNQDGCLSFDTVSVQQNTLPLVVLGNDTSVCASSFTIQALAYSDNIEWYNGDTIANVIITQSGFYWLTATSECGSITDSIYVQFIPSLDSVLAYLPNVFTPNNDNFNETFGLGSFGLNSIEGTMYVYNRWGRLVYKTSDLVWGWNGENHTEGVYYYILEYDDCNGKNAKKSGTITLIRNQ